MSNQLSQSSYLNLSSDPESEGFDLQAGQSWIYPTNYPIRDYQYNIIQKALLNNTLVSLPTGLGKTFIAAVVMYNYFRWYPQGKVVFMAPTRPLVKQQVDACYDIMAIPKEVTAELTGVHVSNSREDIWNEKRVFFITPQILQNDLTKFQDLGLKIKCIVFDEAHKAKGNHAYCEVIRKLVDTNKFFRVLALSATPGGSIKDVLEVVKNLLISHLEFRTEESLDVSPYVFHRNLTTVVVPLGEKLQQVKDDYLKILDFHTRNLVKFKVIHGNCANLTKGKIYFTLMDYKSKASNSSPNYSEIVKSLNICVTLYHAFELLVRHGLRSFVNFYEDHINNPLLRGSNYDILTIMNDLKEYLGPAPSLEQMPDGGYPEIPEDTKFGHPKFYKLRDILVEHFNETGDSSRVIVFFEYRDSVKEAYALLLQSRPILKPRIFLGQSKGVTQRQQINVVKAFREGTCNVLLSTSIGEEGLDVGEVDLIICFDISNKSPIRMVQRMGRTGRKKEGKIVVLVTEGKEQQTLKDCLIHKNNVAAHVLSSRELAKGLNETCPRLVPPGVSPKCEKIFITVKKPVLKKNSSLKDMFRAVSSSSSEPCFSPDLRIVEIQERIPPSTLLFNKESPLDKDPPFSTIFSKRIEKQRSFQETYKVRHSKSSEILVGLLQLVDSKRFNIPMSQLGVASQPNKNLKQTDIRNMFFKSQSANDFVLPSTQISKMVAPSVEEKCTFGSRELFAELSNFLTIEMTDLTKKCKHCPEQVDCARNNILPRPSASLTWIELDESVFSSITLNDLNSFAKSLEKSEYEFDDTVDFDKITTPPPEPDVTLPRVSQNVIELEDLIDHSILTDVFDKSCDFQAPKTLDKLLNKYSTSLVDIEEVTLKNTQAKKDDGKLETTEETTKDEERTVKESESIEELLRFFMLNSLKEIFGHENNMSSSQATVIYSPDIFQESPVLANRSAIRESTPPIVEISSSEEGSPIIGTFHSKRKSKKSLSNSKGSESINVIDSPSYFTLNSTELCSTPNTVRRSLDFSKKHVELRLTPEEPTARLDKNDDIEQSKSETRVTSYTQKSSTESAAKSSESIRKAATKIELDDLCDFSFFVPSTTKIEEDTYTTPKQKESNTHSSPTLSDVVKMSDSYGLADFCDISLIDNLASNLKGDEKLSQGKAGAVRTQNTQKPVSPSQVSITQMISLVNREDVNSQWKRSLESSFSVDDKGVTGKSKKPASQKENASSNILDDDETEVFNFSFNKKRAAPKKASRVSTCAGGGSRKTSPSNEDFVDLGIDLEKSIEKLASNMTLQAYASDEEFETRPKSPVWVRPKPKPLKRTRILPLSPKGNAATCSASVSSRNNNNNKVKKKRKCAFIEDEAELSFCEVTNVSEDEDEEKQDRYDASFVADETYHVDTQMHANYLQSVRSPVLPNRFKIPKNRNLNVYSQEVFDEEDTYLDDSFVVDEEESIMSQKELTELEILEQKLEMQRRQRKKANSVPNPSKRRRIIVDSDSE